MASISPLWVKITDFGISKRWAGTALRTQCGTALYQAPELIGLLPRRMRPEGQLYSWSVDIWALGAIVHQILTSKIPFLELVEIEEDSGYSSLEVEPSIDGELLLDYCAGRLDFPDASLTMHGASKKAIDFVKSLMAPDPKDRVSAGDALESAWLAERVSSLPGTIRSPTHDFPGFPKRQISPVYEQEFRSPLPPVSHNRSGSSGYSDRTALMNLTHRPDIGLPQHNSHHPGRNPDFRAF